MDPFLLFVALMGCFAIYRGGTALQIKLGVGDSEKARLNRIEARKQAVMALEREHQLALAEVRMSRNRELDHFDEQMEAIEGPRGFIAKRIDFYGGAKALETEFDEEFATRGIPTVDEILAVATVANDRNATAYDQLVALRKFLKEEWPANPRSISELSILAEKRTQRFVDASEGRL